MKILIDRVKLQRLIKLNKKNFIMRSNFNFSSSSPYIFCIDQGTTSTRLALIDDSLNIKDIDQMEHKQIHQQTSWTEHSPIELLNNIEILIQNLYKKNESVINNIKIIELKGIKFKNLFSIKNRILKISKQSE